MIVFELECVQGHRFEGWFEDGQAYEDQQAQNLVVCPVCSSSSVCRLPSAFAIKSSPRTDAQPTEPRKALMELGQKIAKYVNSTFDDVGCDFAKEALKIHYGVSEARNIRGSSTPEEEKTLKKEGIDFLKFPVPADSDSD